MNLSKEKHVVVRIGIAEAEQLKQLLFKRYPFDEWATFGRFGWRHTPDSVILTLASIEAPGPNDLDDAAGHVVINEPYTLRMALSTEQSTLGIGVFHSHPLNCAPHPSVIDDDMDEYYSDYFSRFAPGRPYVSIIFSLVCEQLVVSGRVSWQGTWLSVSHFAIEHNPCKTYREEPSASRLLIDRVARLAAAFGEEAATRLANSTVAVIGAGGTGSIVIETLARAGVGRLVLVDPDYVSPSNLERLHGSWPEDAERQVAKVEVARRHIRSISPNCSVDAYFGSLPHADILDAVVQADVAIGCTDQQHSRLSLSDLSIRYLLPSIDCGVMLEGSNGKVTGQIVQLVRFLSSDPCALCRNMVSPNRLAIELMDEDEKLRRQAAAQEALERGEDPDPYWTGPPQLNTVGYLTGVAGSLAAGYTIGWLTGRFDPPFSRIQFNLVSQFLDVQEIDDVNRPDCSCGRARGWADQGIADALISAPPHWPRPMKFVQCD
jgi:tRNA A37 threonylcarbamoyladenosine dehydratase